AVFAIGLSCAFPGSTAPTLQVFIVALVVLLLWRRESARTLAIGATAAAVIILPFVLGSSWRGATFEGLSWLHVAALAVAGLLGCWVARLRSLAIIDGIAVLVLAPICLKPFLAGADYAAGDAPIL